MTEDFTDWTIAQFTEAFRSGAASPVEVAGWALAKARTLNERFGTVLTHIADEEALHLARASERRWRAGTARGALDGVPVTIKNLLGVDGWPLDFCSLTVDPATRADFNAPAVARLREAGMVFIGYTATPEFSWKLVTDSPKYGATRNPHDLERTAGGSSGGAAVCAAAGLAPVHLGSDAAGSIRLPAAFCGVFGMKPTFGTVAAYPAGPLTHIGPIARSVADAALVLDTIGQPDRRDWYNTPFKRTGAFSHCLGRPLTGLRIAYAPRFAGMQPLAEVKALVDLAVQKLADLGACVEEKEPLIVDPREIGRIFFTGGYIARFRAMAAATRARVDPALLSLVERAERHSAEDVRQAYDQRYRLGCQLADFFEDFDLLVTPTTICPAFKLGRNAPDGFADDLAEWSAYTYSFNLAQNPAATVPCGSTEGGLPVGLQIVGPKFSDAAVLAASAELERIGS